MRSSPMLPSVETFMEFKSPPEDRAKLILRGLSLGLLAQGVTVKRLDRPEGLLPTVTAAGERMRFVEVTCYRTVAPEIIYQGYLERMSPGDRKGSYILDIIREERTLELYEPSVTYSELVVATDDTQIQENVHLCGWMPESQLE